MRLIKILFFLVIVGAAGLVGYAYFGDMSPNVQDQSIPVPVPPAAGRDGG